DLDITPASPIDDKPRAPSRRRDNRREPEARETRDADAFRWEPETGEYRYLLEQTFGRQGTPRRIFLVVMLNPGANHLPGFRRSTTCHAVRRWGFAHGYDGAIYVNL